MDPSNPFQGMSFDTYVNLLTLWNTEPVEEGVMETFEKFVQRVYGNYVIDCEPS